MTEKSGRKVKILLFFMALLLCGLDVCAGGGQEQDVPGGKQTASGWKTIKGRKYYYKSDGQLAVKSYKIRGKYYVFDLKGRLLTPKKDSVIQVGDDKFYVTSKGTPIPGWAIIEKNLYYVYEDGRCAAGEVVDKITFTDAGYAKKDCIAKLKMKTMKVVAKITKPGMSKKAKLKKCWRYINSFRFKRKSYPDKTKKNWEYQCALDMLNKKAGNCYGIARGFAALAKELGYDPYVIEIPKIHCWVRINGKYWDNMGNQMGEPKSGRKYKKSQIKKYW